jgi:hypothetical protein
MQGQTTTMEGTTTKTLMRASGEAGSAALEAWTCNFEAGVFKTATVIWLAGKKVRLGRWASALTGLAGRGRRWPTRVQPVPRLAGQGPLVARGSWMRLLGQPPLGLRRVQLDRGWSPCHSSPYHIILRHLSVP